MKNIILEEIEKKDLKKIYELEKENFSEPWSLKIIEETLYYSSVPQFKALIDNKIAGYIFWNIYGKTILAEEAEILNIAVTKEYRRQGIAQELINKVESVLPVSIKYLFLELRKDNFSALNLYKKLGFEEIGIRKKYYKDGTDAILMKKNLY